MENKLFEIRDAGTCIEALAIKLQADVFNLKEKYAIHNKCGYQEQNPLIMLMKIESGETAKTPNDWDISTRTMQIAHSYIQKHFDELKNCDVVDVEYILGITKEKKKHESETFGGCVTW